MSEQESSRAGEGGMMVVCTLGSAGVLRVGPGGQ